MNNYIWKILDQKAWNPIRKQKVFLVCSMLIFCLLGGAVWGLVGRWFVPDITGLLCFVGYPGIFLGFFGGILYLWRQDT